MRAADLVTASILALLGALVIFDSARLGSGWGSDGPKSGFFPFWLALIMVGACAAIIVQELRKRATTLAILSTETFVALRRKYGDEFIRTLGSHAIYSPSAVPGMQQLSAGAVALYAPATFLNSQDVIDKGAPVKFLVSEPVVVTVPLAAVVAKAPHPNFARLLLNFMMTRDGQAAPRSAFSSSSAIASHMSEDFSKAAGIRAMCFSDAATLTCVGNDYGYQHIYEKQIEWLGRQGDLLVAISSSGKSPNILKGVEAPRGHKAEVLTLSGFEPDNPLRGMGDVNLYLPSKQYGFVEAGHLALLSAVVDFAMGWNG